MLALSLSPAGCANDKPPTLLQTVPLKPPIHPGDAFYPAESCALESAKALQPLPADTAMVTVVKDARAWLDRAGMTGLLQKGEKPYDRALAALTQRTLGLPLATLEALRGAGLDPDQPLGLAYLQDLDGVFVSFLALKDGAALAEALKRHSKAHKASFQSRQEGDATMLRMKGEEVPTRVVVLRDGYAYFVGSGRTFEQKEIGRAAKALAQATAEQGLSSSDGFKRAVREVRFGALMASYLTPTFWFGEEIAARKKQLKRATEEVSRYQKRLAKLEATKKKVKNREKLAESFRGLIRSNEKEAAEAQQRLDAIETAGKAVPGVAVGMEVSPTGLRYKLLAALGADLKLDAGAKAAETGNPIAALPWTHTQPEGLHIHAQLPPAGLDGAIEEAADRAHLSRPQHLFKELELDRSEWTKHLSGELMLLGAPPAQRRNTISWGVLALRLRDAKASRDAWQKAVTSTTAAKLIDEEQLVHDKETGIWRYKGYGWCIGFVQDWAVIGGRPETVAAHIKALKEAKSESWLPLIPEPSVASLSAFEDNSMAFLHLPVQKLLPDARGRFGALRDAHEFGMIGLLNSGALRSDFSLGSALMFGELTKKAERLQKRIKKTRAKLESLRRRQRIAQESGRKRVFTALGNSLLWLRQTDSGVAGYGAQLFGEPNIADVMETVTWLLVDSSNASDTAREIAELEQKLKGLEKAFEKMDGKDKFKNGGNIGSMFGDSGLGNVLATDIDMIGGAGGLGLSSSGLGGGGTAEGLGTIGTIGHGSGSGRGFSSRGGGRLSGGSSRDDADRPRRKRR